MLSTGGVVALGVVLAQGDLERRWPRGADHLTRDRSAWCRMWVVLCLAVVSSRVGDGSIDFNRDVRPVLAQNCFPCHGFDASAREARLRLDREEFATAERNGVRPIVPDDPAASEVWLRIDALDPEERMPPPESHHTLTPQHKATLRAWIEQGAAYDEHWAFVAPVRPTSPAGEAYPIDAFVRARLGRGAARGSRCMRRA